MEACFHLSTGRRCLLRNPALPFLAHYHVLFLPHHQRRPSTVEIEEMLLLAHRTARELGRACFGDEECFSILYNGGRTRRRPWQHVHILPARSTAEKRLGLLALSLRSVLRPLLAPRPGMQTAEPLS